MRGPEEAKLWLEQAVHDLRWARHLAESGGHDIACFLSQQVAEKALKALLYHNGDELVLGHSVELLCERVAIYHPELKEACSHWGSLDGFYVPTRYPDALPGSIPARVFGARASASAVSTPDEVVRTVEAILTLEPPPG